MEAVNRDPKSKKGLYRDVVPKIGTTLGTVHFIYSDIWRSFLYFKTLISRKDPKNVPTQVFPEREI